MHDLDAKWILSLSVGSVETIIHEHLKFSKISARWGPKQLTDEHKQQPVSLLSLGIKKTKWISELYYYLWWNMGSSLYTRKQAVVNAVEACVVAKAQEI